ncbi:MAG: phospholipase D-like domain-containing protein [Anaerolineae bacterium]
MTKQTHKSARRREPTLGGILLFLLILVVYVLNQAGVIDLGFLGGEGPATAVAVPGEDWIQVYFTQPQAGDGQGAQAGGLDEILAADLGRAERSIDVAAYDLDLETVAEALLAAQGRGVTVRLVTDTDNVDQRAVRRLKEGGVPVVDDGRAAIMHDKFVVIDGAVVWTGSWNLTESGTYRNDNNAVRLALPELAANYTAEFEEMFVDGAFGPESPADTPHPSLRVGGEDGSEPVVVENYFSPEDGVEARLLALVEGAQESVRFLIYSFTDDDLGQAMVRQAAAGLVVQGVFEARGAESEYGEYERLRNARPPADVLTDGNPYAMHHKVLIVDEEIVVLGSYNWTESASESNDENVLILHDPRVAQLYLAEFERVYGLAR